MSAEIKTGLLIQWWVNNKQVLIFNRYRSTIAFAITLLLGSQPHTHPKQLSSLAILFFFLEEGKADIKMEELPFLIRVAVYFSACFMSGHYPFFPLYCAFFFKWLKKQVFGRDQYKETVEEKI